MWEIDPKANPLHPLAFATLALMLAGNALAEGPPALLIYGPEGPSVAAERAAARVFVEQHQGAPQTPDAHHVSWLLEQVPPLELVGADLESCQGEPVPPQQIQQGEERALVQMLWGRYDDAEAQLDALDAALPCLDALLERELLAQVYYLQGVARAWRGEADAAREQYRRAVLLHPALEWDERFSPEAELLYLESFREALRTPTAALNVEPGLGTEVQAWLDGAPLPEAGGTLALGEGRHLLQWRQGEGPVQSRMLLVEGQASASMMGHADLAQAVLNGTGSGAVRARAETLLGSLEAPADDRVYLAALDEFPLLHSYSTDTGSWAITDRGTALQRTLERERERGRRQLVIGTTGLTATGTGLALGTIGYVTASRLHREADQIGTVETYNTKRTQYTNATLMTYTGYGAVGTGAALLTTWAVMKRKDRRSGLSLGPAAMDGPGVVISWNSAGVEH